MTKLQEIVIGGFLKDNEEIYFDYKEHHFLGRIRENGKYIETKVGRFNSPSPAAGTLLALVDDGELRRMDHPSHIRNRRPEEVVCNGWTRWVNWNGVTLDELRKKVNA
jgi:hypothetical protein